MRRASGKEDPPPPGFERVWLNSGESLLLPAAEVRARAQERQRREDAEEDKRRQELRQRQEATVAQAQQERVAKAMVRWEHKVTKSEPEPGWHRVLPKLADLVREVGMADGIERSADKDVNQRRKHIVEKLLASGPDRRLALPSNWSSAMDELEAGLPHFRAPIRSIRNALALASATGTAPRIPPQMLLGPPGLGKTYFSHRVAELFGSTHAVVQFDQPSAGAQLRGSDKYWANSEPGLLFTRICLGEVANPIVLLDEMDKAAGGGGRNELDPLAQLHGALERETAQCLVDVSVDVEFDASLAVYIGTANSLRGIGLPILSRMEVFAIEPPDRWGAVAIAQAIAEGVLRRLGLYGRVTFERQAIYVLAHFSPRQMSRVAEKAVAAAVAEGRDSIGEGALWNEFPGERDLRVH